MLCCYILRLRQWLDEQDTIRSYANRERKHPCSYIYIFCYLLLISVSLLCPPFDRHSPAHPRDNVNNNPSDANLKIHRHRPSVIGRSPVSPYPVHRARFIDHRRAHKGRPRGRSSFYTTTSTRSRVDTQTSLMHLHPQTGLRSPPRPCNRIPRSRSLSIPIPQRLIITRWTLPCLTLLPTDQSIKDDIPLQQCIRGFTNLAAV